MKLSKIGDYIRHHLPLAMIAELSRDPSPRPFYDYLATNGDQEGDFGKTEDGCSARSK